MTRAAAAARTTPRAAAPPSRAARSVRHRPRPAPLGALMSGDTSSYAEAASEMAAISEDATISEVATSGGCPTSTEASLPHAEHTATPASLLRRLTNCKSPPQEPHSTPEESGFTEV